MVLGSQVEVCFSFIKFFPVEIPFTVSSQEAMSGLTELFQFLDSPNPSARHLALQNLVGHTPKNAAQRGIFIPSSFSGVQANGGGLLPEKRKQGQEDDEGKIKALRDLTALCRDQAVSTPARRGGHGFLKLM